MYRKLAFDKTYNDKVQQLLRTSFKIGASGRLIPRDPQGSVNTPWVFTNFDARRKHCNYWNHVCCGVFNIIPTFCRFNCWKTVVYPRNVFETFQVADVLRSLNLPSKCGADRRNYTYRAWGAYIYGDTLEQGREYYAQIRKAINATLSPDIDIILKRGCTEMERMRPSNEWDDHSEQEKMLEFQLNDIFQLDEMDFRQSAWHVRLVKEGWILRAIEHADPTVEATLAVYGDGNTKLSDLTVHSITYHDTEKKNGNDIGTKRKSSAAKNA